MEVRQHEAVERQLGDKTGGGIILPYILILPVLSITELVLGVVTKNRIFNTLYLNIIPGAHRV